MYFFFTCLDSYVTLNVIIERVMWSSRAAAFVRSNSWGGVAGEAVGTLQRSRWLSRRLLSATAAAQRNFSIVDSTLREGEQFAR